MLKIIIMDYTSIGWITLVIGAVLRYIVARRKFNRRGVGGMEHYKNFESAAGNSLLNWLMKWAGTILIFFGLLSLMIGYGGSKSAQGDVKQEQSRQQ